MLSKLTLTIDQTVIEQAKEYAHQKNRSVSRIVEEYLQNIASRHENNSSRFDIKSPITDSISGMFQDNGKNYKDILDEALMEKYL